MATSFLRPLVAAAAGAASALLAAPAAAQDLTLADVVRMTLSASHDVRIASLAVEREWGALEAARGAFDPTVAISAAGARTASPSRTYAPGEPGAAPGRTVEYAAGVDRRFRNGMVVTPHLTFERLDAPQAAPTSAATASVDLRVPLSRGRGGGMETGLERAARLDLAASRGELRHRQGRAVLRSVEAYWGYAAAAARLRLLQAAETRAGRLVEQTRRLVHADVRPAADLLRVDANRAAKHAARIAGEQELAAAREALVLAMGIPAAAVEGFPAPAQPLPEPADSAHPSIPTAEAALAAALAARADLAAAGQRRNAAADLLRAARGELRPRLDLNLRVAYTGLNDTGAWDPLLGGRRGMHAEVRLSSGMPVGNRAAAGRVAQSAADREEAAAEAAELIRAVSIRTSTVVQTLGRALEELATAGEAVRLHEAAVEAERRRFELGSATLFDVIAAEDALTDAAVSHVGARLRYATARARLGFETGALDPAEAAAEVDVAPLAH